MRGTGEEVEWLQALMDATNARTNAHMAAIVRPERQLNAAQVVRYLQGLMHVAFGTVNASGEPRVSPLDGHFIHGRFTLSTGSERRAGETLNATRPAAPPTTLATDCRRRQQPRRRAHA